MSYSDRKEAVIDDFKEFHDGIGYPLDQTLYATLGEAEYSKDYTQTDECCIYLNFALILIEKDEDIEFMEERLRELISEDNMQQYRKELRTDFADFENDLRILNQEIRNV